MCLLLKKHFLFLSILKTVQVLLNIFVETVKHCFQDYLIKGKFKRTAFISNRSLSKHFETNVFIVTFDQLNASFQNKSINLLGKKNVLTPANF